MRLLVVLESIDHAGQTCKMDKQIFVVHYAFTEFTSFYPTKTTNVKEVLNKLKMHRMTSGDPKRIIWTRPRQRLECQEQMASWKNKLERGAIHEPTKWCKLVPYLQTSSNQEVLQQVLSLWVMKKNRKQSYSAYGKMTTALSSKLPTLQLNDGRRFDGGKKTSR